MVGNECESLAERYPPLHLVPRDAEGRLLLADDKPTELELARLHLELLENGIDPKYFVVQRFEDGFRLLPAGGMSMEMEHPHWRVLRTYLRQPSKDRRSSPRLENTPVTAIDPAPALPKVGCLSLGFAVGLIRLRIESLGLGLVRTTVKDGRGTTRCKLPGNHVVELEHSGSTPKAVVLSDRGGLFAGPLQVANPVGLAVLIHVVDFLIIGQVAEDQRHTTARKLMIADVTGRATMRGNAHSVDSHACTLGEGTPESPPRNRETARISNAEALVRWLERVDRWVLEDAGIEPETHVLRGYTWRSVDTTAGLVAVASRLSSLAKRRGTRRLPRQLAYYADIAHLWHQDPGEDAAQEPWMPTGGDFYTLHGAGGACLGFAHLRTRAPGGRRADPSLHLWTPSKSATVRKSAHALQKLLQEQWAGDQHL